MLDQFSFSMRMRNTCLMCALAPPSPPPLEPPDPELLPELEVLEPLPDPELASDPELAPDPEPDAEPPLVDDEPELLSLPFDPPSGAEGEPLLDPHPPEAPSASARTPSTVGAQPKAVMSAA
jgi:hypothetical protein